MKAHIDWISNRARITPDKIAIIDSETGGRWSYSEVNLRAEKLASYFQSLGVCKGDRVALLSNNDISYCDYFFACIKIGALFVPLNWRLSILELQFIVKDSDPALLGYHLLYSEVAKELDVSNKLLVNNNEYENLVNRGPISKFRSETQHEKDPAAIIYTGGTTGKPKGVVLTHESIMWNSINTITSWNLSVNDVTLTVLPMFHTGGLNALSVPLLMMGGTVVISTKFDPDDVMDVINQEKCTIILMVPSMYHMIIHTKRFKETSFSSMHTFLSGGAPCPLAVYKAFEQKGLPFKEGYGLTEAGPNNFYIDPEQAKTKIGSVGLPMMYNEVRIIQEKQEAELGEVGELIIKGKHLFSHYWNNGIATEEMLKEGWLHTGDLAKQDSDGYFYIVGRKKDMIISGGENIYPLEVEHFLNENEAVQEVAVIALPSEKWGEQVTAAVVLKEGFYATEEELKAFCSEKLARYKIPQRIFFMKELPKTHVGKISKVEIQRLLMQ